MIILVTSGPRSGTGKSTISLGLSAILSMRGVKHELYDLSCESGVCTGVYYYLGDYANDINKLSKLVKLQQGRPPKDFGGVAIVDAPPMDLTQPNYTDLLSRVDVVVVVNSYQPNAVISIDEISKAIPNRDVRILEVCNKTVTEKCEHYLKITPESPFFVIGEPSNFRVFNKLIDELGFRNATKITRINREFTVDKIKSKIVATWDPYEILGIETLSKWYYALLPAVRPVEELIKLASNILSNYLISVFGTTSPYRLLPRNISTH